MSRKHVCILLLLLPCLLFAQRRANPSANPNPLPPAGTSAEVEDGLKSMEALEIQTRVGDPQQMAKLRLARFRAIQQSLQKDSDRLLELANQLKQYSAASGSTLSVDMVKKAEEAEKTAKRIKNNMRQQF